MAKPQKGFAGEIIGCKRLVTSFKNKFGRTSWECECILCGRTTKTEHHKISNICRCINIVDRIGEVYGTKRIVGQNKATSHWIVACEKCGNKTTASSMRDLTKSCKCLVGAASKKWRGFGEISGAHWSSIKHCAAARGMKIEITIEEAWQVALDQMVDDFVICVISGEPLTFRQTITEPLGTASLDRIDNDLDYIKGNVQWIHKRFQSWRMRGRNNDQIIRDSLKIAKHHMTINGLSLDGLIQKLEQNLNN